MALSVDLTTTVGSGPRWDGAYKVCVRKATLDTADARILAEGTRTSTDVYKMIDIPAGTYVIACWAETVEAEATNTTATIAIGDGDGTAGYLTAAVPSTTVGAFTAEAYNGTAAYHALAGRFYTSADTIDVLVGTAAFTNGVYNIYALCVEMES